MKTSGVLHAELSEIIARIGHGQTIVISDYGLPVPACTAMIDLAIRKGIPSFLDVLQSVLEDLVVEEATVAAELRDANTTLLTEIESIVGKPVKFFPHETFKQLVGDAIVVVRTGEHTPYANVILKAGVVF
jgi:D-ribose pyranase